MTHDYRHARSRPALNHLLGLTLGALLLRSSFGYPRRLPHAATGFRSASGLDARNEGSRLGWCMVEPGVLLLPPARRLYIRTLYHHLQRCPVNRTVYGRWLSPPRIKVYFFRSVNSGDRFCLHKFKWTCFTPHFDSFEKYRRTYNLTLMCSGLKWGHNSLFRYASRNYTWRLLRCPV